MPKEIERKFLVDAEQWRQVTGKTGKAYQQGYISTDPVKTVRVRIADHEAFLTIKGATTGISRAEYEYPIPPADARELLDHFCSAVITKTRYRVPFEGKVWEVDEFHGDNDGLIVAEMELQDEAETFALPAWAGREVTEDARYYNASLSRHPYRSWAPE